MTPLLWYCCMAEYHDCDFDVEEWAIEAAELYTLPPVSCEPGDASAVEASGASPELGQCGDWDAFYGAHSTGNFFKPRRYLALEFGAYLGKRQGQEEVQGQGVHAVCEVGCGYGCSMFPLLERFGFSYVATDYSQGALSILQQHPRFDPQRCALLRWDVTQPPSEALLSACASACASTPISSVFTPLPLPLPLAVLAVFALSAVHPEQHLACLLHMRQLLTTAHTAAPASISPASSPAPVPSSPAPSASASSSGVILFRDYGVHDITMYRHNRRLSQHLFQRPDDTLAYYFDLQYVQSLADRARLRVLELRYATVRTENRKSGAVMRRVYVHAVLVVDE
ncbi:hypothetical protein B484DRAFT_396059 [Ochromonadaceae sp. CCMP2298]|nr:hypothetical protein B484DRAFT_396059 [Ochromonadaceae sp. CCMP2298]